MGGRRTLVRTLAVACFFGAIATSLSAQPVTSMKVRVVDATAATASNKTNAAQTAGTSVTAALQATPAPQDDGLRKDPRWPQLRSCIENTATPKEFETCLHTTLMTDTTGFGTAVASK
jgi:hypothetical protein